MFYPSVIVIHINYHRKAAMQKLEKILNTYNGTNAEYVLLNLQLSIQEREEFSRDLSGILSARQANTLCAAVEVLTNYKNSQLTVLEAVVSVQLSECHEHALLIFIEQKATNPSLTLCEVDNLIEQHVKPYAEYCSC
jgi:hypothetical protein